MATEDVKKLDEKSAIYINEVLELLEVYNKYAEQITKIYEPFLNKGLKAFPSTHSV